MKGLCLAAAVEDDNHRCLSHRRGATLRSLGLGFLGLFRWSFVLLHAAREI